MKKVINRGTGVIGYNNDFICIGGSNITVLNKNDMSIYAAFKNPRDISDLNIDLQKLYVKTTSGVYYVFDLAQKSLLLRTTCKEKLDSSHDGDFYVLKDMVILDILALKDERYNLIKYNLSNKQYEKIILSDNNYTVHNWRYDKISKIVYAFCVQKNCMAYEKTNCFFYKIDVNKMSILEKRQLSFNHGTHVRGMINANTVLIQDMRNMQAFDVHSMSFKSIDTINLFKKSDAGYFVKIDNLTPDMFALVFSKKILIYSQGLYELKFSFDCEYGSTVSYINGKIYVGTWNGLFIAE